MRKLICLFVLAGCTKMEFVRTQPAAGARHPRAGSDVHLYFGTEPQKAYEKVGYFERAPNDFVNDTGGEVADELRRKAGYEGCDGVIVPAKAELDRLAASTTERVKAFCVMYTGALASSAPAAGAEPAAKPEPAMTDAQACEKGKGEACVRLGIEAETNKDIPAAYAFFDKACAAPNPRGCTHKAIFLLQGPTGVSKDETQALELFTKACVLDDMIACRYQGVMYVEGKGGVKKSALGGLGYLEKACTAKDGWACWRISQVYKKGEGTAKDGEKAKSFEQVACDNGYEQACKK